MDSALCAYIALLCHDDNELTTMINIDHDDHDDDDVKTQNNNNVNNGEHNDGDQNDDDHHGEHKGHIEFVCLLVPPHSPRLPLRSCSNPPLRLRDTHKYVYCWIVLLNPDAARPILPACHLYDCIVWLYDKHHLIMMIIAASPYIEGEDVSFWLSPDSSIGLIVPCWHH